MGDGEVSTLSIDNWKELVGKVLEASPAIMIGIAMGKGDIGEIGVDPINAQILMVG